MSASATLTKEVGPFPVSTSAGTRFYRPELDVLRFFAFLCVFLHHGPHPWIALDPGRREMALRKGFTLIQDTGAYGMCLFFFLSSFLITELLQRERLRTGTIHLRAFYMRRILRIWPLYFAFIIFCALLGWLLPAVYPLEWQRVGAFFLLAGNWFAAVHGSTPNPIGPLWSISLEEQFYLIWPMLSRVGGPSGIVIGALTLIPVAFVNIYLCSSVFGVTTWWNSFVHFLFFALGGLLALGLKGRVFDFRPAMRGYLFVSGLACWLLAERLTGMKRYLYAVVPPIPLSAGYILISVGCVLIFFAFHGAAAGFFPRWLVYLGKISFGLYVFHVGCYLATYWFLDLGSPKMDFVARFVLGMAMTVPLAILSYEFFEKPFLRLKDRFTFVPSRAA